MKTGPRINPVRKNIVKTAILQGHSYRSALKQAGYSEGHINRSSANTIVIESLKEISAGFDKSLVTPELVLSSISKELKAESAADRLRAAELLGKYLAIFTERSISTNLDVRITPDDQDYFNRIKNKISSDDKIELPKHPVGKLT